MNLRWSFCVVGISLFLSPLFGHSFLTDLRHWSSSHDDIANAFLPICRVCSCSRRSGVVECVPRRDADQFQLNRIQLPLWANSLLSMANFSFAAFPLFAGASHLRQLRLRHCSIAAPFSPSAFVPFHSLQSVHLTDCRLRDGGDNALPDELFRPLGQLRELSLSGNGLRHVRIELSHILDRLDLSHNPLCPSQTNSGDSPGTEWPSTKQLRLENANVLAMNSTHLKFGEAKNGQKQNNSLKSDECLLPISDNHWQALEQLQIGQNSALQVHPSVLPRLINLRHLDFSGAASVPEELFLEWTRHANAQWLHIGLRKARIKSTNAAYQQPTAAGVANRRHNRWTLCSAKLEWLDISELGGIEGGTLHLDGCAALKWLYVDANALGGIRIGDSGPAALLSLSARDNYLRRWPAGLLRSTHSLSSVQLANNAIVRLPLGLLEQYTQLNSLDLSQNALRHFHFGDLFRPHNNLLFLNLSQNQLSSVELPTLSNLTVLDLSYNILTKFNSLDRLPTLENLHLSGNTGVRLTVAAEHPALVRLHLAKCSLTKMPDLNRLVALRELNLCGNLLHSVPGHWLPSRGVNVLDIGSNGLQELGWDWSTDQLDALRELRAMGNPWECSCAFAPPLGQLLTEAAQTQQMQNESSHFCSPEAANKCAEKSEDNEKKKQLKRETAADEEDNLAMGRDSDPNAFAIFLPPLALIASAFVGIVLLVRNSLRRHCLNNSSVSSHFAYQLLTKPNGEAI